MQYDFHSPRHAIVGWGRSSELATHAKEWGTRCWIVSGSRTLNQNGTLAALQTQLHAAKIQSQLFWTQTGEPTVADVDQATRELRAAIDSHGIAASNWLLVLGGGSAIDLRESGRRNAHQRAGCKRR